MTSSTNGNTVRVPCGHDESATQNVDDVSVAIDLTRDVAYVVHGCTDAPHWQEISRADAELLVAVGAHAHVVIGVSAAEARLP